MSKIQEIFESVFLKGPTAKSKMSFLYEENGIPLASYEKDALLIPASNTKLVHTVAALKMQQDNFDILPDLEVWVTERPKGGYLRGNLYLDSCGSLFFTSRFSKNTSCFDKNSSLRMAVKQFVDSLKNFGISKVEGDLKLEFSRWNGLKNNSHYNAATPFAFNENTVETFVVDGQMRTCPEKPLMVEFKKDQSVRTQTKISNNTICYNPQVNSEDYWRLSKIDVNEYARQMLKRELIANGLIFEDQLTDKKAAVKLLSVKAGELSSYIKPINTFSDNLRAELLALQLNRLMSKQAIYEGLSLNLKNYFLKELPGDFVIVDGSGLSRENRLSSSLIIRLLDLAAQSSFHHNFERSLAIAGKTGTLKQRFKDTAFEGRFLGKTGTLNKVTALSGYWYKDPYTKVTLSFIGNGAENADYWQSLENFAAGLS